MLLPREVWGGKLHYEWKSSNFVEIFHSLCNFSKSFFILEVWWMSPMGVLAKEIPKLEKAHA
jgi:hypothetical protein